MHRGLTQTDQAQPVGAHSLLPRPVRRLVIGGVALVLTGAVYLVAVRGEALLQDLGTIAAYCF
jgi:hypothetical protein